jgi:C4-dicarboxylate-specific signal transduction histidine kinase
LVHSGRHASDGDPRGRREVVGALAFSPLGRERVWQDDLVQRLRLLGEVFASILSRRRADLEVRRLRRDLDHVARVSTMGELTASLAHELSQPLTAILSNAEAAERILGSEGANREEVRAILQDMVEDDKRAAAVISRLRGLLWRGVLELAVLDLNELMAEVARLGPRRADAGPDRAGAAGRAGGGRAAALHRVHHGLR